MKKRIIALVLPAVLICLMLTSCSPAKLKVNGVKIDNEIYAYFEDEGKKSELADIDLDSFVKGRVSRYTAVNSEFTNRGLTLSTQQKAELSTTVNDLWHLYGAYYKKVGVGKQTIYKIEQSKLYEQSLLAFYYGENGASPISEDEIKAFFGENYVAVRFVTGYLFDIDDKGVSVPMSEEKRTNTVNTFTSVATMVNNGTAIEEAVGALGENTEIHDSVVNSSAQSLFPEGFFDAAKKIETGKASAVVLGNYIFLVQRVDAFSEEYDYYSTYRTECLKLMKGEEFSKIVDEWAKSYVAE